MINGVKQFASRVVLEDHVALISIIVLARSKCRNTIDPALLAAGSDDINNINTPISGIWQVLCTRCMHDVG